MGIYHQNRIIKWIGDVILIPLGTFKPTDGRHVCPGTSTWVFDMWSIFIGITQPTRILWLRVNYK